MHVCGDGGAAIIGCSIKSNNSFFKFQIPPNCLVAPDSLRGAATVQQCPGVSRATHVEASFVFVTLII